jgi:hypothetical protein
MLQFATLHACYKVASDLSQWPYYASQTRPFFRENHINGLLGPLRFGRRYQFIVHVDRINAFIEKAQEVGDRRTGGQRFAVAPHDVLEDPLANRGGPIRCLAFVGTTGRGLSRL